MASLVDPQDPTFQEHPGTHQWRPKVTPYRSFVFLSMIGLGSGKAFATARGLSLVATYIEWISGVIIFCLIYVLGLLESNPPCNRFLFWFLAHNILQRGQHPSQYVSGPIISGYRLMTTFSVILFGVLKAYLTYRHQSPAADTVDWIFGVVLTSCLYVLGLYEDNPVKLMPYLFFTNYGSLVFASSRIFIYLACTSFFEMTFIPLLDLRAIYNQIPDEDPQGEGTMYQCIMPLPETLGMGLKNLSIHFAKTFFLLLSHIAGIYAFWAIFLFLLHSIGVFAFIRHGWVRISSTVPTRFQLDTTIRKLGSFFHDKMSRFVFKITMYLIVWPPCIIFLLALSYLTLDMSACIFFLTPDSPIWLFILCFPFSLLYLVLTILVFGCSMVCLYYFICLLFILFYSLASREIPAIFNPRPMYTHQTFFWDPVNFFDIF